jgi:putative addiction module component (TIGR02574 family)
MRFMNAKQLREAALALPPDERAELARDLLHSLEDPPSAEVDAAWVVEIEKRARELDDGAVVPVDWEEAQARVLQRLRRTAS